MPDTMMHPRADQDHGFTISADELRAMAKAEGLGVDAQAARRWMRKFVQIASHKRPINGPTEKPADVRCASIADETALHKLMMQDVRDNALKIAAPSPDRVMFNIRLATRPSRTKMPAILGLIEGPDHQPVAAILLIAFQWWWSEAFFLQEVFAYVHPDHRSSTHAVHLMKFAKWCSDSMSEQFGYPVWLFQGVTAHENVQRKMMFYSQHTNQIGGLYLYPCPWSEPK